MVLLAQKGLLWLVSNTVVLQEIRLLVLVYRWSAHYHFDGFDISFCLGYTRTYILEEKIYPRPLNQVDINEGRV